MSEMKVGDDVVVIGTGSIGMYCLMAAAAAGAGRLIAVDVSDFALGNGLNDWVPRTSSTRITPLPWNPLPRFFPRGPIW